MGKILVTGGTVFVSKFVASWFVSQGEDVYVLNRNTRPQVPGVHLIEADRRKMGDCLKAYDFDAVLDVTSYTRQNVEDLVNALGSFRDYIFISSSAVYPETLPQTQGPHTVLKEPHSILPTLEANPRHGAP